MDPSAKRVRAVCGAAAGFVLGVLVAPGLQWRLHRVFGVDVVSIEPAIVIVTIAVVVGACAGWLTTPRVPGN